MPRFLFSAETRLQPRFGPEALAASTNPAPRQIAAQSVKRQVTGGFGRGFGSGAGVRGRLRFISGAPIVAAGPHRARPMSQSGLLRFPDDP